MRRYWPLTLLGLVIALCGLFAYVYHVHTVRAVAADKARFVQADRDIAALSADIIAATGQPLKVDYKKFCSRPSVEIGDSPLSCDVDSYDFYAVQDSNHATALFTKINAEVGRRWRRTSLQTSSNMNGLASFSEINVTQYLFDSDNQRIAGEYIVGDNHLKCNVTYIFYKATSPPYSNYPENTESPYILAAKLGCGDSAKAQYYPMNH